MRNIVLNIRNYLRRLYKNLLYKNAGYLFGVNFIGAIAGFLFWIIAARTYPQEDIGVASALISLCSFLATLASLGIGPGLIRHLSEEKNTVLLIKTAIIVTSVNSVFVGVLYFFGINVWENQNTYMSRNVVYFLGVVSLTCFFSLSSLVQFFFQGFRESRYAFWHIVIWDILGLCLLIIFTYINLSQFGIVSAQSISLLIANFVSYLYFLPKISGVSSLRFEFSRKILQKLMPYSFGNYFADLFYRAPLLLTPTIVLALLNSKASASAYFAWMMGWIITSPGHSLAGSIFSEGSFAPEKLILLIKKSLPKILLITISISLITFLFSPNILTLLGKVYSIEASALLKWLALSSVFMVINFMYFSILRVEKKIIELLTMCIISAVISFAVSLSLLFQIGVLSTGIGWFVSQLVVMLFGIHKIKKLLNKITLPVID